MDERTTVPAVELLNTLGWTTQHLHMPDEPVGLRGASNLENEQGDLMQIRWWSSCNADFWSSSVKVERDDFSLGVASSTDQLLDASVPGLNWHRVPFFLRVTHAMLVFRYAKGEVDWDRLTTDAHERQLVLALLDVLAYARELGACVPDIAMDRLRNTPVSTTEKYEYKYKIGRQTFMRRLGILWLNYRRVARRSANGGRNLRFVDYLRMRWRMGGLWELPRHVLGVIRRSFRGN
ncbi:MAG: hypothetical protein OEQ18_09045 [Gammaproteobacteria bacterium]|nr:hypothetical protein [Gammaproteobacteria bacterium]